MTQNCSHDGNVTCHTSELPYTTWQTILILAACFIVITGTVIGNILVCMAVAIVRKLRTPSNLLIVSLAVSDLLVAILVMSLAAVYDVMGTWVLGQAACDAWTSLDVFLCTASILNLCAISIDRYLVITRPFQYAVSRTPLNMAVMIAFVWVLSALISIPPLFVNRDNTKAAEEGQCMVNPQLGYQIYATVGAFYLPLTVMIVIYTRIYMVSARISLAETRSSQQSGNSSLSERCSPRLMVRGLQQEENHNGETSSSEHSTYKDHCNHLNIPNDQNNCFGSSPAKIRSKKIKKFKLFQKTKFNQRVASSHDRKATKTLGVIMGAFTACWLPFFIVALIRSFCEHPETCIAPWLNSLFLWLGYTNSFLNPIIYARFNRDFRTPFKEILLCRCREINIRMRTESYVEQYGLSGGMGTVRSMSRPSVDTVVRYNCNQGYAYIKVGCKDEAAATDDANTDQNN